jgi:uncharacterized repeat protein (TIGR03803 family)
MRHSYNLAATLLSAGLLAACGGIGVAPSSGLPGAVPGSRGLSGSPAHAERHSSIAYAVLHSFGGSGDGTNPYAGLIDVKGTLYGTTDDGGTNGYGTAFAMTTSGSEAVLYSFKGGSGDGGYPTADIVNVKGTLYGTTEYGGAYGSGYHGNGTVFAIIKSGKNSGKESVLHSFGGSGDGDNPETLINVGGALYGTTVNGGANGLGTVFSITPSGKETVLYSFKGGSGDGEYPLAGLVNVMGTLYGTTAYGGATNNGTVFKITTSGGETPLHSFGGSGDGIRPLAGLINVSGTLYGTTFQGGANGHGTVFAIIESGKKSGKESVLYSFGATSADAANPEARLLNVKGTLYSTTFQGGTINDGTVFAITLSGTETVLYSFKAGSGDGANPAAGLIDVKGTLYGTTENGGANQGGIAFSLTP